MMHTIAEHAPMAALLFFFMVYVVIAVRAYRPSAKSQMLQHSLIPLEEDHHG